VTNTTAGRTSARDRTSYGCRHRILRERIEAFVSDIRAAA